MKERLQWIDIGKGIGICLMYYGHIGCPDIILRMIYAFHMPLFFFLSGYVLSINMPFAKFIKKKIKGLIRPFLIFGVLVILVNFIISLLINNDYDLLYNLYYLFAQQMGTPARLWFIPCLFISSLISYFILNSRHDVIWFLCFNVAAWLNVYYFSINIPWYIDVAIICSFFMILGYRLKEQKYNLFLDTLQLWCISILFIILTIINSYCGVVDIARNLYANPILFYTNAVLGIIVTINVAIRINNKYIEYIGYNSLLFMFLNSIAIKLVRKIISLLKISLFNEQIMNLIILMISLLLVYQICTVIRKYFSNIIKKIGLI